MNETICSTTKVLVSFSGQNRWFRDKWGRESDENGSDYNSSFVENQDGKGEFSMSDMDDGQKNFAIQKLNPALKKTSFAERQPTTQSEETKSI